MGTSIILLQFPPIYSKSESLTQALCREEEFYVFKHRDNTLIAYYDILKMSCRKSPGGNVQVK